MSGSSLRTITLADGPLAWPMAEPDDVLDYVADATAVLADGDDTIRTASLSVSPSGDGELVVASVSVSGALITTWLAGGPAGRWYTIKLVIETLRRRTFEFPIDLRIDPRLADWPVDRPPETGFSDPVSWNARPNFYGISPVLLGGF